MTPQRRVCSLFSLSSLFLRGPLRLARCARDTSIACLMFTCACFVPFFLLECCHGQNSEQNSITMVRKRSNDGLDFNIWRRWRLRGLGYAGVRLAGTIAHGRSRFEQKSLKQHSNVLCTVYGSESFVRTTSFYLDSRHPIRIMLQNLITGW